MPTIDSFVFMLHFLFFSFLGFQYHFPFFGFHAKSRCSSSSLHVEEAAVKKRKRFWHGGRTDLFPHADEMFSLRTHTFLETCDLPFVCAIFMNLDFPLYFPSMRKFLSRL